MLYKIPLILICALYYDRSFTAPQPHASARQQKRTETNPKSILGLFERIVIHVAVWTKIGYWLLSVCEIAAILASHFPDLEISRHARESSVLSSSHSVEIITPTYIIGSVLIIIGANLRFYCFKVMGDRFTFALSLRDSHKLCTSGPYSIVRHPSYTGGHRTIIGAVMTLMCNGSWWFGAGYSTPLGVALGLNWFLSGVFSACAYLRGKKEDEFLRKEFGKQWDDWAKKVPYRYIPGIV